MKKRMTLEELRTSRGLTQNDLAEELEVSQAWVSRLEHAPNMRVDTLRKYVEAVGGDLQLQARFGNKLVKLPIGG